MTDESKSYVIDDQDIQKEVDQYIREKAKIDRVLRSIEKLKGGWIYKLFDIGFIIALILLFVLRFIFEVVDNILSLELGILLISLKIIWLIKVQNNYNHFIFMIMHTIDQHQNTIIEKLDRIETNQRSSHD